MKYIPKSKMIKYGVRMVDGKDPDKSYHMFTTYIRNTSHTHQALLRRLHEHEITMPHGKTMFVYVGNRKWQIQRRIDEYPLFEFIEQE
jgi:hypothetical protein